MSRNPISRPRIEPRRSLADCEMVACAVVSSIAPRMVVFPIIMTMTMPAISMTPSPDVMMSLVPMLKLFNRSMVSISLGLQRRLPDWRDTIVGVVDVGFDRLKAAAAISNRGGGPLLAVGGVRSGE